MRIESDFIVQARMLRLFDLMNTMFHRPCELNEIASKLAVSKRTVYRYMKLFEGWGIAVDCNHRNQYFIAQDDCPVCHHEIKTDEDPFSLEPDFRQIDSCHDLSDWKAYLSVASMEENQLPTFGFTS